MVGGLKPGGGGGGDPSVGAIVLVGGTDVGDASVPWLRKATVVPRTAAKAATAPAICIDRRRIGDFGCGSVGFASAAACGAGSRGLIIVGAAMV